MNTLDHEIDMWDAIAAQDSPASGDAVPTAHTRRGERVVILTRADIDRTADTGRVLTTDGDTVVWYTLGRPFKRGADMVAYGYLRFDRAVVAERDRRRSQAAWNAAH